MKELQPREGRRTSATEHHTFWAGRAKITPSRIFGIANLSLAPKRPRELHPHGAVSTPAKGGEKPHNTSKTCSQKPPKMGVYGGLGGIKTRKKSTWFWVWDQSPPEVVFRIWPFLPRFGGVYNIYSSCIFFKFMCVCSVV